VTDAGILAEQVEALRDRVDDAISGGDIAAFFDDIIPDAAEFSPRLRCQAVRHITPRDDARRRAAPGRAVLLPRPARAWIPG
jgi:hypothetical protein